MKISELNLKETDDKTIPAGGIVFPLSDYTVLIGENNSGKTNILNAFKELKGKECNVIYLPANEIELGSSDQANTAKKTSPFYKLLAEILKDEKLDINEEVVGPINKKLKQISDDINATASFIKNKQIDLGILNSLDEESAIKNLIPLKVVDKYWQELKKVNPEDIGQGSQRIFIFALLKYFSQKNIKSDRLNLFIFEEPEVYLHPKLKIDLNEVLYIIAQSPNNQVLISSHDPFFVEVKRDDKVKTVVAIHRNKDGYTEVSNLEVGKVFPYMSYNEINWLTFGVNGLQYLNELYGYLEERLGGRYCVDYQIYCLGQSRSEIRKQYNGKYKSCICTAIRDEFHHNTGETDITNEITIHDSIDKLRKIVIKYSTVIFLEGTTDCSSKLK